MTANIKHSRIENHMDALGQENSGIKMKAADKYIIFTGNRINIEQPSVTRKATK